MSINLQTKFLYDGEYQIFYDTRLVEKGKHTTLIDALWRLESHIEKAKPLTCKHVIMRSRFSRDYRKLEFPSIIKFARNKSNDKEYSFEDIDNVIFEWMHKEKSYENIKSHRWA